MKTGRELFEKLPDIKAILQSGFQFNEDLNQYYHLDHTSHRLNYAFLMGAWLGWQSSAQRQGYKLVPVGLADEIEDKIWDNLSANHTITNQEGDGFIPVEDIDLGAIYKAMMGVGE